MTCIVGMEYNGKTYIAADQTGFSPNSKINHTQPKVFKVGDFVFGYTSSYRFGQIIEHFLPSPVLPKDKKDIYKWLVTTVVEDIRKVLKEHGYEEGGTALIGVGGELWKFASNDCVLRSTNGYDAVGCGDEYANASIFTSLKYTDIKSVNDVKKTLSIAVETAHTFSPTVGPDVTILST